MALTYGFYNSLDGDRKYNAEQVSSIFDGIIGDGVYATIGKAFTVSAGTGMQVIVGSGRAWFNHTWSLNDADIPLTIEPADVTLKRIDAVVLEINAEETVRMNSIKIIKGTPATSPVKPTLVKSEKVNQYPFAYITVNASATAIMAANIENRVGTSECPFVTGIIDTIDIDLLLQQWDGEFDNWMTDNESDFQAWWTNIKTVLNDNVATNLQNQIDERVKTADKATTAEAQAGTSTTKWMTPALVAAYLTYKFATTAQAQAGSSTTVVMSPARVKEYVTYILATQAEAKAGSVNTKLMTPLRTANYLTAMKATIAEAEAATNDTHWLSPATAKIVAAKVGMTKRVCIRYDKSGTFVVPSNAIGNAFKIICVGGGSAGTSNVGGCSGYVTISDKTLTGGTSYSITVGAGGTSSSTSGGTTKFGSLVTASGGTTTQGNAGGGNGGKGSTYGGGGGAGSTTAGGAGGTFGGGGGGGCSSDATVSAGAKSTYGGAGGAGGASPKAGSNGTRFPLSTTYLFPYVIDPGATSGLGGAPHDAKGGGGGGGGYGGNGGKGSGTGIIGGGGGGGGYGSNGGNAMSSNGGGGGGYGGRGGDSSTTYIGGGGGFFATGGEIDDLINARPLCQQGGAGGCGGSSPSDAQKVGGSGCCVILYDIAD